MSKTIASLCLFCFCSLGYAQECNDSRPYSTPTENFFINEDGTVTNLDSGLTWMRCSIGQQWNGQTCVGEAKKFTWREAFTIEDEINNSNAYANLNNWRLPKLPELASIVERQCNFPRINLTLFPATPSQPFWTANHKKNTVPQAYAIDFANEGVLAQPQNARLYLRLVSGRE